jgi:ureidoglycolate lyase
MIKKKINELTMEKFSKYGTYADMLKPVGIKFGEEPIEFYRDMVRLDLGQSNTAAFSLCRLIKRELVVVASEYHNHTGEMIIALDGDILMHVGPAIASGEVPVEDIEIFRIPKGVLVSINPGVWHHAAFPYMCDSVNVLVALPERTYMNDCFVVELPEERQIEII